MDARKPWSEVFWKMHTLRSVKALRRLGVETTEQLLRAAVNENFRERVLSLKNVGGYTYMEIMCAAARAKRAKLGRDKFRLAML